MGAAAKLRAVIEGNLDGYTIDALRAVVMEAPRGISLRIESPAIVPAPATATPVIVLPRRADRAIADLIAQVAFETGVSAARIIGKGQAAPDVRARTAVCWGAIELLGRGYSEIGRVLGNRDHSTIRAASHRAARWLLRDPAFVRLTAKLRSFVEEPSQ